MDNSIKHKMILIILGIILGLFIIANIFGYRDMENALFILFFIVCYIYVIHIFNIHKIMNNSYFLEKMFW